MPIILRAPRIVWLLLGLAIPLLLVILGMGLWSLSSLDYTRNAAMEDRTTLNLGNMALNTARIAQVHFKIQIQEWKNLLLRGHDPADREHYLGEFSRQSHLTRTQLEHLRRHFLVLEMGDESQSLLEQTMQSHAQLVSLYLDTLGLNDLADPMVVRRLDLAIRGRDRILTEQFEQLVDQVKAQVSDMTDHSWERDQARYQDLARRLSLTPSIILLLLIPMAFYLTRRLLVKPIITMTGTMTCISNGTLEKEVKEEGCLELRVMARRFNTMAERLKHTLDGLHTEKNKLTTIILSAREGIVVTDREGNVVLVNPAAERLLGKSTEQIAAGGFQRLLDDPEYIKALLHHEGRYVPDTVVYNNRMLVVHAATIEDNTHQEIGSAAILRDVTSEKRLEEQLRLLSVTDGLTGLFNRRRMDEILRAEFERVRRFQQPLSVLLTDVDHFKKFNDTHGHDQGDRVLQSLASIMKRQFREVDFPCRYGGEEFCIILPGTGRPGALLAAERLRKEVESTPVDGLKVTISIGVSIYHGQSSAFASPEDLLKMADVALYTAKQSGRNRTCENVPEDASCAI